MAVGGVGTQTHVTGYQQVWEFMTNQLHRQDGGVVRGVGQRARLILEGSRCGQGKRDGWSMGGDHLETLAATCIVIAYFK